MLSHLVLSTKEDEAALASCIKADVHDLFVMMVPALQMGIASMEEAVGRRFPAVEVIPLPQAPDLGSHPLRGPPVVA